MQDEDQDRLLTREEVEHRFGITKRYLEVSARRGDGPNLVRVGRSIRYRVKDIRYWIDENTIPGAGR